MWVTNHLHGKAAELCYSVTTTKYISSISYQLLDWRNFQKSMIQLSEE